MSTIYEILRASKGAAYSEDKIKKYSYLHMQPKIDKPAGALAGLSRIHGDASPQVQDRIIDMLVEIGARYKLPYRDIAHMLLFCKIESGFNPDAAAGTTSAAGLGQYTKATVEEAAKEEVSKKRLGFVLELDGHVFDAERGAYGIALSYMIAKERAIKYFGKNYEKNLYLFHHEGWYFQATADNMAEERPKAVLKIIQTKILPFLDPLEKLLSAKTNLSFKLLTKDDKPYAGQPYVAIYPAKAGTQGRPVKVQGSKDKPEVVLGKTDGNGHTSPIIAPGLSEVLFVILHPDYKDLLQVNGNSVEETHEVKDHETLSKIAKDHHTTVAELQKINHIANPNQLKVGQQLKLHEGEYLWRRPPMSLIGAYLQQAMNVHPAAVPAMVEHKRSHIVLPQGNQAQQHAGTQQVVAIRGGATSDELAQRKREKAVKHKTVEKDIKKQVVKPPPAAGKAIKEGLLFPFEQRPSASYHEGARQFNSSRGVRRHAGCDLYAPVGTEVRAMADGVILQCYPFYWHTDAVEVDHGDFIVRYGEVAPRSAKEQQAMRGKEVKRGDVIGKVGQLIKENGTRHKDTMLHLELYSSTLSTAKSPLSDKKRGPFQRRADLMDPTATLDKCVMT
ncbi:LysM peptidoglycan-binding domain-containing M23 family metallopeptidase [Duganella vulcania]|uniref:LysM peptidoglycan-binding domain-containing protein n=1 Tax=Duganella vulcania TaxID=2692166 RepID=A0A845GKM7_9BURK|nr:LysM peptidoglycan-binding domain-containing protein [Duganella vulcania]